MLALTGAMVALVLVPSLAVAPAASAAIAASSRVVYDSSLAPAGLWLMNADGTSPVRFKAGANGATFSADGTKMAYQIGGGVACNVNFGPGQIVSSNANGSNPVTVGTGCSPRISPDGTRVLYMGPPVNGSPDPVYVASLSDPTHPKQILPFPGCIMWVVHAYPKYPNMESVCNIDQLAAWVGNNTIVVSGYQDGLWELPAAGGHPHPILSGQDQDSDWYGGLSVSPDGSTIVGYPLSQPVKGEVLATVPAGGGALRVLFSQGAGTSAYDYPEWLDNQTLVLQHLSGTPAHLTSRIAVTPVATFSPQDINRSDTTAAFPALAPASGLEVSVKVLGIIRSGLAVDDDYPSDGPVNFTVPTAGGQDGSEYTAPADEGQKCMSGCANVLVTVLDSLTHQPVEGATVTASVDPIPKLDLENTASQSAVSEFLAKDNEFLCLQADRAPGVPQSPCGTELSSGLTTNRLGHVYLVYWAPGLVDTAQTTLNVSAAKQTCLQGACAFKGGTANPARLVVRPYLIYQHTGTLAAPEVGLLVEFAQEPNTIVADMALDNYAEHLLKSALKALALFQKHAASIAASSGLVVAIAVHVVEAFKKYGEQLGLIATLLEAEDLSTLGLGEEPYATSVPLDASSAFTGRILSGLGNIPVPGLPKTGPTGILWSDALALNEQQKRVGTGFATRPESIDLKVYEISHCDESYPVCGPGYRYLPAQSSLALELHHGIQAQLCFYFTGSGGFPGLKWSDQFCENQYAAPYWVVSQPNLNRALP